MKYITIFYPNSLVLQQLNLRSSSQSSRLTPLIKWKPVNGITRVKTSQKLISSCQEPTYEKHDK